MRAGQTGLRAAAVAWFLLLGVQPAARASLLTCAQQVHVAYRGCRHGASSREDRLQCRAARAGWELQCDAQSP